MVIINTRNRFVAFATPFCFEAWNDTAVVSKKAEQQTKRDIYEKLRDVSTSSGVKREMEICLFGELLILRERANI